MSTLIISLLICLCQWRSQPGVGPVVPGPPKTFKDKIAF